MKVHWAEATGCSVGGFVIEAETNAERGLLSAFINYPRNAQNPQQFWLHSSQYRSDQEGAQSFFFGWHEAKE